MTFKQLNKTLLRSAEQLTLAGDLAKAYACLELFNLISERGYDQSRIRFELEELFPS